MRYQTVKTQVLLAEKQLFRLFPLSDSALLHKLFIFAFKTGKC